MKQWISAFWTWLRSVSGDDAYERYCERHMRTHPDVPPLARRDFYVEEQKRRWGGINRCC